ncbi:hypothetical protein HHK36_000668 [Tetracentron sinense]|uniref:Uncharacterized protein n=1 Tax=Tetracentron sinense TaxID=13715 RepID=A0A834ZSC7_TETSI|nr:hypothetical protein HHK36_000668 [Tetracentron sinense]
MQRLHQLVRDHCPSFLQCSTSFLSLLETATDSRKLHQIHAHMIVTGIIIHPFAANRLLSSPALIQPDYARSIFSQISSPNLFIWNTMIKKLTENDKSFTYPPFLLYKQMLKTGTKPNSHTFMYLTKAFVAGSHLLEGEEIHANVVKTGFGSSQFILSALIGLYVVCGFADRGRKLFDEMSQPSLVLWTVMMRAYVCVNCPKEALLLFQKMRVAEMMPDSVALATAVSACSQLGDLGIAKMMHGFICKSGIEIDAFVSSGLLSMFGDSGNLNLAYQLFCEMPMKNIVVWNTMIHQCVEHDSLELMQHLFNIMPDRDVVSWNTIIGGLSQAGRCKEAVALFHEMELSDVKPNGLTLLSVLSACASLGALDTGTWIHAYAEKNNLNSKGSLDSSLIDMYSKCGSIDKSVQVFQKVPIRDLFSWTSLICGLAMHGHGKQALHYFSRMQAVGVQPDDVTMVGVLHACAHAGLLNEGWQYFRTMEKVYNLSPKVEHYGCMIDLLGRMGHLEEAYDLIMELPVDPNEVIWGALLSACRVHRNVELGEIAAKRLLELDPSDPWARVMLSNMYAEACRWDGVMRLRKEMKERGVRKTPGCSSIEVTGRVHEFLVGDKSHPQQSEIHSMLERLNNVEIMMKWNSTSYYINVEK